MPRSQDNHSSFTPNSFNARLRFADWIDATPPRAIPYRMYTTAAPATPTIAFTQVSSSRIVPSDNHAPAKSNFWRSNSSFEWTWDGFIREVSRGSEGQG